MYYIYIYIYILTIATKEKFIWPKANYYFTLLWYQSIKDPQHGRINIMHLNHYFTNYTKHKPSTSITTSANTLNTNSSSIPSFINPHNIVTVKLNHDNFLLWKAQIIPYMRGHRVFGFIDGTITHRHK